MNLMNMKSKLTIDVSNCRKDPEQAIAFLAENLRDGTLGLAIGAGVSKYLNLPSWSELVNECSRAAGLLEDMTAKSTPVELSERMEIIEKKYSSGKLENGKSSNYRKIVHDGLYAKVNYNKVLHGELLMALGALLMGSRRGCIREVINFNFDDVLEWYLYLHGYDINVISTLPALKTGADITIYHPHGFLPLHDIFDESDFLIFSQDSYDSKMGDIREPWTELTKYFLRSKIMLFIGLSGADPTFGPMFKSVQGELGVSRKTGLWLFGPNADKTKLDAIQERNFVPLEFKSFEDWPGFILKICQAAVESPASIT
jgi:SIR2-like domain